jgi:hypothetical protein
VSVAKWHPGKLAMIWAGVVTLYFVLGYYAHPADYVGSLVLLVAVAGAATVITWRWFSARDRR